LRTTAWTKEFKATRSSLASGSVRNRACRKCCRLCSHCDGNFNFSSRTLAILIPTRCCSKVLGSAVESGKPKGTQLKQKPPFARHECFFRLAESPTMPERENNLSPDIPIIGHPLVSHLRAVALRRCLVQNECRAPQKIWKKEPRPMHDTRSGYFLTRPMPSAESLHVLVSSFKSCQFLGCSCSAFAS